MRLRTLPIPGVDGATMTCAPVPIRMGTAYKDTISSDISVLEAVEWVARAMLAVIVVNVEGLPYGDPYPADVEARAEWWLSTADVNGLLECSAVALDGGRDVEGKPAAPDA